MSIGRRKNMMRTLATLALALAAAPGALHAQQKLDEKRSAAPDGVVAIDNQAGSIHVIGWSRSEITVTGTLGQAAEGLDISGGGRRTSISVDTTSPHGTRSDLEIHLPAGSRVEIDSFAAEIRVNDVNGNVSAETVNGSIFISGGSREIQASSVNGVVEVSGPSKRVHAESVNGAVTVRGASGEIEASTVNGQLSVVGASFDRANLETVSGGLRFEGDLGPKATVEAQTVSGNVDFVLPAAVKADFTVTTFSGDIQNEFGPAAKRVSKYTTEKELEFSTGEGGADVSIETLSGGIRLAKKP
jgi:DUF4097 and DUF4098 domain-containing protein YvlB